MADNKDLKFGIKLDVDIAKFKNDWKDKEKQIQGIINSGKFVLDISGLFESLNTYLDGVDKSSKKAGKSISKNISEGADEGIRTIQSLESEVESLMQAIKSTDLGDSGSINESLARTRDLTKEIKEAMAGGRPLGEILSDMDRKDLTGAGLKKLKTELQSFLTTAQEATPAAKEARKALEEIKERISVHSGKQASALKDTDAEKTLKSQVAAYKKLEDAITKTILKIQERNSLEKGRVVSIKSIEGTKREMELIEKSKQQMAQLRSEIDKTNRSRLDPTPLEMANREVQIRENQVKIESKLIQEKQKRAELEARLNSIIQQGDDKSVSGIQKTIKALQSLNGKLGFDPKLAQKASNEIGRLEQKMSSLKVSGEGLKQSLASLEKQWGMLNAKERKGAEGRELLQKYRELSAEAGKYSGTLRQTEKQLNRTDKALVANNSALKNQRGLLNGLPQMLNAYVSVLGAFRFVKNLRDITAEFELQRVALGAIIQDAERAERLFGEIKVKALASPFTVKDMTTFTKQLAAFRVPTEELYDTMTRLADISAGLGVGMDRIILAYGQVRAASVLRGQELRQFTEAGIPLVDLLAKKFSELNGYAVTTTEVFQLISERAVPFKMIDEIFRDLTESGGTFFNMQEIQAKSLYGVYANLKDAIQLMYDEMGRENRGVLLQAGLLARKLAENWRAVYAIMMPLVAAFIGYNAVLRISGTRVRFLIESERLAALSAKLDAAGKTKQAAAALAAANANNVLTRSFHKLNLAMKTNPILFWVSVATTAITAIAGLVSGVKMLKSNMVELGEEMEKSSKMIQDEFEKQKDAFENSVKALRGTTEGSIRYNEILGDILSRYSDFLPEQSLVAKSYDAIAASAGQATTAMALAAAKKAEIAAKSRIEGARDERLSTERGDFMKFLTEKMNLSLREAYALADWVEMQEGTIKDFSSLPDTIDDVTAKMVGTFKINKYIKDINEIKKQTDDLLAYQMEHIKEIYGDPAVELIRITKEINDRYDAEKKRIEENIEKSKAKEHLQNNEISRLRELIKLNKEYGDLADVKAYQEELQKLVSTGDGWRSIVQGIVEQRGSLANVYSVQTEQGENTVAYMKRIQEEYKNTKEQLEGLYQYKPELRDESGIEREKTHISILEEIASALGFDLEEAASGKSQSDKFKAELARIKEAYNTYEDFKKYVSEDRAREEASVHFPGIDLSLGLPESIEAAAKRFNVDAVDEINKALADDALKKTEATFDVIYKNMEDVIKGYQDKYNFYSLLLGEGMTKEKASQLVFGEGGAKDVVGFLIEQIENASKQAGFKIELNKGDNTPFSEQLGEAYPGLPDAIKKQIDAIEEYRVKARRDSWLSFLKITSGDVPSGAGFGFSISSITAEYKKKLGEIYAQAEQLRANLDTETHDSITEWETASVNAEKEVYRQKLASMGSAYIKQKLQDDQLYESYSDMSRASLNTLEKIRAAFGKIKNEIAGEESIKAMMESLGLTEDAEIVNRMGEILGGENALAGLNRELDEQKKLGDGANKSLMHMLELYLSLFPAINNANHEVAKMTSKRIAEAFNDISSSINDTISSVESLADAFGVKLNKEALNAATAVLTSTSGIISTISGLVDEFGNTIALSAYMASESIKTVEKASVVLTIISLAMQAITAIGESISAAIDKKRELKQAQIEYLDLVRQLKYEAGSRGAWGNVQKAIQGARVAQKELNKAIGDGFRYIVKGWSWYRGETWKFRNVLDDYPELLETLADGTRVLNVELAEQFMATHDLSDAERARLERAIELSEEYEGYLERQLDYFGDIAETISSDIVDALFESGNEMKDWTDDITGYMTDAFANMVKDILIEMYLLDIKEKMALELAAAKTAEERAAVFAKYIGITVNATEKAQKDLDAYDAAWREQTGQSLFKTKETELSGISKSIASMTEETALTLGGYANSLLLYSVKKYDVLERMYNQMESNDSAITLKNMYDIQSSALGHLKAIEANTQRSAMASEALSTLLVGVSKGTKTLRVELS
jgi:tape measure domain-containing protein